MARRVLDSGINLTRGTGRPRQRQELTGAATPAGDGPEPWLVEQVSGMTVADALAAVEAGTLDAGQALAAERAGKDRSSLVSALERASSG